MPQRDPTRDPRYMAALHVQQELLPTLQKKRRNALGLAVTVDLWLSVSRG